LKKLEKEEDLSIGAKMAHADSFSITREAQIEAYKKHEISKKLRETWTQQCHMKNNEKNVASIF